MGDTSETVLTVDVTHEEELAADGFDLFVTVRGSSVFTGRSAFDKAAEVKALVASVVSIGVVRDDISLVGLQVDVESGLLSKSSSARYSLRVRSHEVDKLTGVLSAIASAKNATVDRLEWRYPEGEEARHGWLRAAARKARGRADAMAEALGIAITGIKRVSAPIAAAITPVPGMQGGGMESYSSSYGGAPAPGRSGRVDLGLEVAPTKRVEIDVRVELLAKPATPIP